MKRHKKYQVVIPARGGSKRFPGKNIAMLDNQPLIGHSIRYAQKHFSDDQIWVNTDSDSIIAAVAPYGTRICKRPEHLATDLSSTLEVMQHQLAYFEAENISCDALILLQVTNPLRPAFLMEEAIRLFEASGRNSLVSFSELKRKFGLIKDEYFVPENYKPGQRMQDLVPRYHENGLIYITDAGAIRGGAIITEDCFPMVVDHPFGDIDIDEPYDLIKAELTLKQFGNE